MVVYLDLIFFLNLLIDAATLHTTAWSQKLQAKTWRIWAAAVIGACYVLMMFLPALSVLYTFIAKTIFSIVMIMTAFGYSSLQQFLRNLGAFYLVNFIAAGAIIGLHYIFQSRGEVWNGMLYSRSGGITFQLKIGLIFILVIFFLAVFFYKIIIKGLIRKEKMVQFTAKVQVWIGEHCVESVGLVDTGNRLYEPLTRTPVMIMEAGLWNDVLPKTWLNHIGSAHSNELLQLVDEEPFPWPDRLRFVPYKGIHGAAFLLALKPDRVVIMHEGKEILAQKVFVALKGGTLSSDASFQAIIHPELIQEEPVPHQVAQLSRQGNV